MNLPLFFRLTFRRELHGDVGLVYDIQTAQRLQCVCAFVCGCVYVACVCLFAYVRWEPVCTFLAPEKVMACLGKLKTKKYVTVYP